MTILLDINVLLDVFAVRQPHYLASAQVLSRVFAGEIPGVVAAHELTTLYYLARKQTDAATAETAVDQVIEHCQIRCLDLSGWRKCRSLPLADFEDSVIAVTAEVSGCDLIVTRNLPHFTGSPVVAVTPADFLCSLPPPL